MFQPGDKVRFLNEALEGEITRKLAGDRFEVVDKEGFIHQAAQKELVAVTFVLEKNDPTADITSTNIDNLGQSNSIPAIVEKNHLVRYLEQDGTVYGVLELMQPTSPLTSEVELWLVNATDLQLVFVSSREKGDYRTHPVVGQLEPHSECRLELFSQDQLYKMNGIEFQFIFFSKSEYRPRNPLVKHMELRPGDLLEAAVRAGTPFDRTLKVPLVVLREEQVDVTKLMKRFTVDEDDLRSKSHTSRGKTKSNFSFLSREKVVDLHIEELIKDPTGMSAGQMIAHQLSVFDREMDQALLDHLNRITFVHGVGNGVLRSAIREALKKYDHIRYSDAPAEKFGNGATQIDFT
jgi:hypothetical protein